MYPNCPPSPPIGRCMSALRRGGLLPASLSTSLFVFVCMSLRPISRIDNKEIGRIASGLGLFGGDRLWDRILVGEGGPAGCVSSSELLTKETSSIEEMSSLSKRRLASSPPPPSLDSSTEKPSSSPAVAASKRSSKLCTSCEVAASTPPSDTAAKSAPSSEAPRRGDTKSAFGFDLKRIPEIGVPEAA